MTYHIIQNQILRVLAISCLSILLLSKNVHANEDVENTAKSELKEMLNNLSSFQTDFSQIITDINGNELQSSSGKLSLQKPNQLRWETMLPDETLLIADGTTVWNIDPFVEQVTLIAQKKITESNPLMLLVSDDDEQWTSVRVNRVEMTPEQTETGQANDNSAPAKVIAFDVISLDENANIVSLTITFKNEQLSSLKSIDRQQQQSRLTFMNSKKNERLSEGLFTFEVPSNFIIDDQRSQ
jgi:outer membrane lipoprotein carrier protein